MGRAAGAAAKYATARNSPFQPSLDSRPRPCSAQARSRGTRGSGSRANSGAEVERNCAPSRRDTPDRSRPISAHASASSSPSRAKSAGGTAKYAAAPSREVGSRTASRSPTATQRAKSPAPNARHAAGALRQYPCASVSETPASRSPAARIVSRTAAGRASSSARTDGESAPRCSSRFPRRRWRGSNHRRRSDDMEPGGATGWQGSGGRAVADIGPTRGRRTPGGGRAIGYT